MTMRKMRLPKNSSYPDYNETHMEDEWCERAGCTPVCDPAPTASKGGPGTQAAPGTLPLGSSDSRVVPSVAACVPSSAEGVGGAPEHTSSAEESKPCSACGGFHLDDGLIHWTMMGDESAGVCWSEDNDHYPDAGIFKVAANIGEVTCYKCLRFYVTMNDLKKAAPVPDEVGMPAREQFEEMHGLRPPAFAWETALTWDRSFAYFNDGWQAASSLRGTGERERCDTELEREWKESSEYATEQALESAEPATYFADRDTLFRFERIVDDWRRAIKSNQGLEEKAEKLRECIFSPYLNEPDSGGCCAVCGHYFLNVKEMLTKPHNEECRFAELLKP